MKTIYRLIYCDGELSPSIVDYLVPVGISNYEQLSLQWLQDFTRNDNRFFFSINSAEVADFIYRIWSSFPQSSTLPNSTLHYHRSIKASPVELRRFLQKFPPEFLNSDKVIFEKTLSAFL